MLHQTRFTYGQRVYLIKQKAEGVIDTILIRSEYDIRYKIKLANSCYLTVFQEDIEEVV